MKCGIIVNINQSRRIGKSLGFDPSGCGFESYLWYMGFLKEIFNDVVDIASVPVKVAAKVTDDVMESDIEDYVDELKDTIKCEDEE